MSLEKEGPLDISQAMHVTRAIPPSELQPKCVEKKK